MILGDFWFLSDPLGINRDVLFIAILPSSLKMVVRHLHSATAPESHAGAGTVVKSGGFRIGAMRFLFDFQQELCVVTIIFCDDDLFAKWLVRHFCKSVAKLQVL